MKQLHGKVAVITGAGSGIGQELAFGLAREGCLLALADLNAQGLEETVRRLTQCGARASSHLVDVSRCDQVYAFAREVVETYGAVHLVINNAGVGLSETIEDMKYEDFEWVMNINFWGIVYCTKAFLPHLKKQPQAQLVNVSSILGLVAVAAQSAYTAAKFAVRGFTEALRQEMRGSSVRVTCAYPGGTRTNIARSARFYKSMDGHTTREESVRRFEKRAPTSPEHAARVIIKGIKKDRRRILVGTDTRFMDVLQRLLPSFYDGILNLTVTLARLMRL